MRSSHCGINDNKPERINANAPHQKVIRLMNYTIDYEMVQAMITAPHALK